MHNSADERTTPKGRPKKSQENELPNGSARKGGVLAALRKPPLAGADLNLRQPRTTLRKLDL
jgi:hypothetical protein